MGEWDAFPAVPTASAAAPATDPWAAFPAVPNNVARGAKPSTVAGDMGLAALTSPQEAIARLAATPAAIESIGSMIGHGAVKGPLMAANALGVPGADKALDYVNKAYSKPSLAATALQTVDSLPSIKKGTDTAINAVVPGRDDMSIFYKPNTPEGGMVQEGLVGALSGAAGGAAGAGALSGIGGEAGRQIFKGTPLEGPANLVGSLAGGFLPSAGRMMGLTGRPEEILSRNMESITALPKEQQTAVLAEAQRLRDAATDQGVNVSGLQTIPQAMENLKLGGTNRLSGLQRALEESRGGEGVFGPFNAQVPGQVRNAGEGLLTDTFGAPTLPESAVANAQSAAEGAVKKTIDARVEAGKPSFSTAAEEALPLSTPLGAGRPNMQGKYTISGGPSGANTMGEALDTLKKETDKQIGLSAPNTPVRTELERFRTQLNEGFDAEKQTQAFGPLQSANQILRRRLDLGYNPLDTESMNPIVSGVMAPLNKNLTEVLERSSPSFAKGMQAHIDNSPAVNAAMQGSEGRIAGAGDTDPVAKLKSMSNEFLDPSLARPERIKQLAATLSEQNPDAVRDLVGARLKNVFDKHTADLQSGPNYMGGPKFVTDVMGNAQARANLEATIKTLPSGGSKWAGFVKFTDVMKTLAKRLPTGPATAQKLDMQEELRGNFDAAQDVAKNPLAFTGLLTTPLIERANRLNAATLAKLATGPDAEQALMKLAIANPKSRHAQTLVGQILGTIGAEQRSEDQPGNVPTMAPAATKEGQPMHIDIPYNPPAAINQPVAPAAAPGPVSATGRDRDLMIRTLYGEARGEPPAGQAAVAYSILNRAKQRGQDISQVVLAPKQYQSWSNPALRQLSPKSPTYQKLAAVVDQVLSGQVADQTNGATHFIAPELQAERGDKMPPWAQKPVAQVGNHLFYAPDKG